MDICVGNFRTFGAFLDGNDVIITFSSRKNVEKIQLVIYDASDFDEIERIDLGQDYALGRVYSVCIKNFDYKKYGYLISEDEKLRVDPYCSALAFRDNWADVEQRKLHDFSTLGLVSDLKSGWKDKKVDIEPKDMVLYKLHMRGFTAGNNLSVNKVGNYIGLISKLDYIKKLGVTSIEIMPIYDFDELYLENKLLISPTGERSESVEYAGKINYWGYGKASYFAPKASYFGGGLEACNNLRKLVSAIHENGMELIMEMSFDNEISNDLVLDCLKYYVEYFHIDGFHIIGCNAPIERIAADPFLSDTKIFYEFIPEEILVSETCKKHLFIYNDSFMNVTRQIQNHMNGSMVQFANHMRRQNAAYGFVNYMANVCGFSLFDSYSYGEKHNMANGEDNRDGTNSNFSFNNGYEGKTNNKSINAKRFLDMRNAFAALILSQSVPMIVAGDEVAATHEGNNNPYCQDNKVGYTVFSKTKNKQILKMFVTELIKFRKLHPCIRPDDSFSMNDNKHLGLPDMSFHGSEPWMMYIGEEQKALGVLYCGAYAGEDEDVYICYNYHYDEVDMALPILANKKRWRKITNTLEFDENSDFSPKVINNQQSIKVPGSSITILVGMRP